MSESWWVQASHIFLHAVALAGLAPLVEGVIRKVKALLQNRTGAPIWQPFWDLVKSFRKEAVLSEHASFVSRAAPYIVWATTVTAGLLVPSYAARAPLETAGGVAILALLFGFARFWTAAAALDSGGSFGGMAASRDMALNVLAEPALLLAAWAVTQPDGTLAARTLQQLDPSWFVAVPGLLLAVLAEAGRLPVNNPDTHLELTMVHEGMLLEYSGRHWGFMAWALQIKQLILFGLLANALFPWENPSGVIAPIVYLFKVAGVAVLVAVIETWSAKIRFFRVPKMLGFSAALSLAALTARALAS